MDKRIQYYSDNKFKSYSDLFLGGRSKNPTKKLIDQASTGVIRLLLHLCQMSFKYSQKFDHINQKISKAVISTYAGHKERRITPNEMILYRNLLQVISKSRQHRFVFASDNLGKYPTPIRQFIYDMFKNEFLFRKKSYIIFNQALWMGSNAIQGLYKKLKNSTISVIDFKDNEFQIVGSKEKPKEVKNFDYYYKEHDKKPLVINTTHETESNESEFDEKELEIPEIGNEIEVSDAHEIVPEYSSNDIDQQWSVEAYGAKFNVAKSNNNIKR